MITFQRTNEITAEGRENPERIQEPPYVEPVEPHVKPMEVPVVHPPEKQNAPIPETPPLKPQ